MNNQSTICLIAVHKPLKANETQLLLFFSAGCIIFFRSFSSFWYEKTNKYTYVQFFGPWRPIMNCSAQYSQNNLPQVFQICFSRDERLKCSPDW